mgnify:CR=1 FL=1
MALRRMAVERIRFRHAHPEGGDSQDLNTNAMAYAIEELMRQPCPESRHEIDGLHGAPSNPQDLPKPFKASTISFFRNLVNDISDFL